MGLVTRADHLAELAELGAPDSAARALAVYLDLVARWDRRVDLTGARDSGGRARVLVRDPLAVAPLVEGETLLDVGSGNGSPGLVLALLRPELRVCLLEPREKRWAFLRDACRALERRDVSVLRSRHDQYGGPPARTVTMRGLQLPLAELGPCVAPNGRLLVIGGSPRATPPFVREPAPSGSPARLFRRCST